MRVVQKPNLIGIHPHTTEIIFGKVSGDRVRAPLPICRAPPLQNLKCTLSIMMLKGLSGPEFDVLSHESISVYL